MVSQAHPVFYNIVVYHAPWVVGYFKNKVEGYKKQDKVADREIDLENYVDEDLCLKHFHGCCAHCGVKFYIGMKAGKLSKSLDIVRSFKYWNP